MNIILFCNRDLESNFAYHLLKPVLADHEVHIFLSESVGSDAHKPSDLLILERYEKKLFFEIPQLLEDQGLDSSFEFFDHNFSSAPLAVCQKVNTQEFIEKIRSLKPDLFISIRFGKIFRDEIIGIPAKGILNLHSGILPDYRGILGTLHALREGRSEVGCTLHFIDSSSIDTGKIIDIAYLPVDPEHSLFWHVLNLYPIGCARIADLILRVKKKEVIATENQDLTQGNYFSLPDSNHFEQLKERGFGVFNPFEYTDFLKEYICPDLILNL